MITAKSIIELIEREKLIVYFVLLWAGSFFFYNLGSTIYYFGHLTTAAYGVAAFSNLLELFAGVMLGLLGFTLLFNGFKLPITKERLLVFFLLLWAGSFFFWGIYAFIDIGPITAENTLYLLGGVFDLIAGAVLALFSLKLMGINTTRSDLPPPPP
jgi:hypothetical protein